MQYALAGLMGNIGLFDVIFYYSNIKKQKNVAGNDCLFRKPVALPFFKGITYIAYGQLFQRSTRFQRLICYKNTGIGTVYF